ncbi:Alpha/Beta hydrolase protein [Mycena alexandri]|uniref:Alpha/Beta hydrolase protein n=1 Tax=Mycena alexandri TaxID=1745969 RepID=A0AAD6S7J0_9AGAR|nr:Alpha/Beta hydrolase protein [Mycena alexandri]
MTPSISNYFPYLPLLVPSVLAAYYVLASRPTTSKNQLYPPVDPGLASLPLNSRARVVYSEDWLEGGAYANLPLGRVRYWLVGPTSGKKIVLIHGLTTPSLVFQRLVPILVAAGHQVLVYDLYGRGYSDAPKNIDYDAHLYVTQLALLLQHVGWERARLVGFSMGGAIAAAIVAAFPKLVERDVVLIASAGAAESSPAPFYRIRNLPFVEGLTMRGVLSSVVKIPPTDETPLNEIVRLQAASLRGFTHAVISSLHEGPISHARWMFGVPAWCGRRVLFVHGTRDTVVPPRSSPFLRSLIDSVPAETSKGGINSDSVDGRKDMQVKTELVSIGGAGHDLIWTHAEEVGKAIVSFLDEK